VVGNRDTHRAEFLAEPAHITFEPNAKELGCPSRQRPEQRDAPTASHLLADVEDAALHRVLAADRPFKCVSSPADRRRRRGTSGLRDGAEGVACQAGPSAFVQLTDTDSLRTARKARAAAVATARGDVVRAWADDG
jgi:hypothetical protein